MDSLPYIQFYTNDFMMDERVSAMTDEECGFYIRLFCRAWREGSIPADLETLAQLTNRKVSYVRKVWPKVSVCFRDRGDGRLIQPRMEHEREKAIAAGERNSAAAKKAADKRWEEHRKKVGQGDPPALRSHAEGAAQSHAAALRTHGEQPGQPNAIAMRSDANQIQNQSQNQKQKQTLSPTEVPSLPRATKHEESELANRGDSPPRDSVKDALRSIRDLLDDKFEQRRGEESNSEGFDGSECADLAPAVL